MDSDLAASAQIRATFYPKFENEEPDKKVRQTMLERVSCGDAVLEVSLKHSGSLFMYAGNEGGAYSKNSYGNIYTAVGIFVLDRMFNEAWGTDAIEKQSKFNTFLEDNRICISMELVTAVLGDHGQRPQEDYVVVTAIAELGNGKPNFYSTPDIIAFCRTWRLPTNHVWLFSTRESVESFFATFDDLYEEGTATVVCEALDKVADLSVPGSIDHIKAQGEILEGLVGRIVSHDSLKSMEAILKKYPLPQLHCVDHDMGRQILLRRICAEKTDEEEKIKAILETIPADYSTAKLQEIIRLVQEKTGKGEKAFKVEVKCYTNRHKMSLMSGDNLHYKMVIHVRDDLTFQKYKEKMRSNPELWPLYRGFFVDLNLFKVNKETTDAEGSNVLAKEVNCDCGTSTSRTEVLAAYKDTTLMIKLKFLKYKSQTFLIRNGLKTLYREEGEVLKAYKKEYSRQMSKWNVSARKQEELSKMLDKWAGYILKKKQNGEKQVQARTYLHEVEPFLLREILQKKLLFHDSNGNNASAQNFIFGCSHDNIISVRGEGIPGVMGL
ncbi:tRNA ligase [Thalictrum thalictroides]|uniref:tRNA ligase n=1 Tax=Thalictrum thalictroides TaxID=46969 RepID=A0A7J6W0S1_THATH|nr:tRNA ligase [Thalictrum thalictroides]